MRYLFAILFYLAQFLFPLSSCSATEVRLSKADIEKKLAVLKPLPKVHYSWKIEYGGLLEPPNEELLYQWARITHALCVAGETVTESQIEKCVYTCARINRLNPEMGCRMGINFSPWHRKFGKDLPPTDRGPTYAEELKYFSDRMQLIKHWIEIANQKYNSEIQIGALLLDSERFQVKEGNPKWNEAMREALDAIHDEAVDIFPKACIEWYGRGIQRVYSGDGWAQSPYFTGKEKLTTLSCAFFCVPEMEIIRETFRRTCALADELGVKEVTPHVALGSGYKPGLLGHRKWSSNWNYDLIYSWILGAELNIPWYSQRPKRYAPYDRAKIIVFYPGPFYDNYPVWPIHFIAYVRGATGVSELVDLGYEE